MTRGEFRHRVYLPAKRRHRRERLEAFVFWVGVPLIVGGAWAALAVLVGWRLGVFK